MSYEGYTQFLCEGGHYWTIDSFELFYAEKEKISCPICKKKVKWENSVNVTNGSFDEEGNRIDGYEKLQLEECHLMKCDSCDRKKVCACSKYKIPEGNKNDK